MATLRVNIMVCDVCGDRDKPAQRYSVTFPGEKPRRMDLCVDDAAGLEAYRKVQSTGRAARKVYSPEEIEEMRKKKK